MIEAINSSSPKSEEGATAKLHNLFERIEHDYKIGNVDAPSPTSSGRRAFEELIGEAQQILKQQGDAVEYTSQYYKFLAIQAETKEYLDTATPGERLDLYHVSQGLWKELSKQAIDRENLNEQKKVKNIIRVVVAGLEHLYSIDDYSTGIREAHRLLEFVNNRLVSDGRRAHGTLAILYYFLARNYRQRGIDDDYQKAIEYFYQTSECYFEMARHRDNKKDDVIYARTRAMVSLGFGAGFLFYTAQSDLGKAKALIAPARLAFLRDDGQICCALHYHYLELLFASILKAEAGEISLYEDDDPEKTQAEEKLDLALKTIENCEKSLESKPTYLVHVLFNKGLIYLYMGPDHYSEARDCVRNLFELCSAHPRWQANALVLRSHLDRREGRFDMALESAMKAYSLAANHLPVRVEALLARGQAQLARERFGPAQVDFERVLEMTGDANLKPRAAALLLLAETALSQQNEDEARKRLGQAAPIMINIGHGFLKHKFRQLTKQVRDIQKDFVIRGDTEVMDYKQFDSALQRWLLERVLREDRNLARAARKLQVSKKTIYMWIKKHEIKF